MLLLRRFLPESPRWLMTHGQPHEAEAVVAGIEARVRSDTSGPLPPVPDSRIAAAPRRAHAWFGAGLRDAAVAPIAAAPCSASR